MEIIVHDYNEENQSAFCAQDPLAVTWDSNNHAREWFIALYIDDNNDRIMRVDNLERCTQYCYNEWVTVNIHFPKKALPSTYLLANKYSPVFFSQDKKTPGSVYLPVNKYCLGKYLLPFSYSVSIIGHNSHRFTPKPSLRQIKSKFSPK